MDQVQQSLQQVSFTTFPLCHGDHECMNLLRVPPHPGQPAQPLPRHTTGKQAPDGGALFDKFCMRLYKTQIPFLNKTTVTAESRKAPE